MEDRAARSLREMIDDRDAALFTGRRSETHRLARFLDDASRGGVAIVHGPRGIGKSMLLRQTVRHAREMGYDVSWVDGRSADASDDLMSRLPAVEAKGTLLVVDTYEAIQGLDAELRSRLADHRPVRGRLLIGSRVWPGGPWGKPPWDDTTVIDLGPLPRVDAVALVERRGGSRVPEEVLAWAGGEPLALAVAADALVSENGFDPGSAGDDQAIARTVLGRLAGNELSATRSETLVAASIAKAVGVEALGAMLPQIDPGDAEVWLRGLTFTEPLEGRVAVHSRIREAVRTLIRAEDPAQYRELRRRLAYHLYDKASKGQLRT